MITVQQRLVSSEIIKIPQSSSACVFNESDRYNMSTIEKKSFYVVDVQAVTVSTGSAATPNRLGPFAVMPNG